MKIDKNRRIVIIGAGPSGISAAVKLFENGFTNVTILEAEDRIGGRVHTVKLGEYNVDLGAQWVQGEEGNVVYDLASPHDLLEISNGKLEDKLVFQYLDSRGNDVNREVIDGFSDFYVNYLTEQPYESDTKENSSGSHLISRFEEHFEDNLVVVKEKKALLNFMERSIVCVDPAESWLDVSTTHLFEFYAGDQTANWRERGFSTVLDVLLKRYPNSDHEIPIINNTILNTEVTLIDYSQRDLSNSVFIKTANGQIYEADHVIVTVSLGVLKEKYDTMFNPPLPKLKAKTIEDFGFGSIAKIFLLFDEPFWKVDGKKMALFNFLWNEADLKTIENDPERSWLMGLYRAHTVEHKPKLLQLWVTGRYAKEMESLSEDKVLNHCVESLQRFLGKRYKVTRPTAMLRTQWFTNPHFKGTYIYRTVKTQKLGLDSNDLEEPVSPENLKILFAGEATSKHRYATVDGAIVSGRKAADRIINFYEETVV